MVNTPLPPEKLAAVIASQVLFRAPGKRHPDLRGNAVGPVVSLLVADFAWRGEWAVVEAIARPAEHLRALILHYPHRAALLHECDPSIVRCVAIAASSWLRSPEWRELLDECARYVSIAGNQLKPVRRGRLKRAMWRGLDLAYVYRGLPIPCSREAARAIVARGGLDESD